MIDSGSAGLRSLLACSALGIVACAGLDGAAFNGREVELGSASGSSRDVSSCTAEGCGASTDDFMVLDESGFPTCRPIEMEPIEVAWEQALRDEMYEPVQIGDCGTAPRCLLEVTAMTAATDRSLWVAGLLRPLINDEDSYPEANAVWLAHHASDGGLLMYHLVDVETLLRGEVVTYQVALAAGQDGHVFLLVDKELGKEGFFQPERSQRLEEFAPEGAPVAGPITLGGDHRFGYLPPLLAPAGGGAVAIVSGDRIALMDADRTLRWVQAGPERVKVMASDTRQQVSLSLEMDFDAGEIQHYDALGRQLWRRSLTVNGDARVEVDLDGNVTRLAMMQASVSTSVPFPNDATRELLVHKISSAGDSIWGLRFSVPGLLSNVARNAAIDASNRAWMLGAIVWSEQGAVPGNLIYEISPDGERCAEHVIDGASAFEMLVPIPGGGLYALWQDGYGRLEL